MRMLLAVLFSLSLVSPAFAQKAPDVKEALVHWVAAVESGSVDDIVDLYDPHAIMISTFVQKPITTHAALVAYYKKVVVNPDAKIDIVEQHARIFGGDMAVNTGLYTFHYTEDGEPVTIPARFSFTYQLQGGKWIIVDHHSSRIPLSKEPK